ncbi:MAG: TetR/AcrR family transcriptional regulator [Muribaculaceae bacterium]
MDNNMLRRKIITTATECFFKYGIDNTSMNYISYTLHISKRTLYQLFASKRNLLEACVTFKLLTIKERIAQQCERLGPIETIVCINYETCAFFKELYPVFRKDVIRYAEVISIFDKEYRIPLRDMCSEQFNIAKKRGLIQTDSNFELAYYIFENTLLTMPTTSNDTGKQTEIYHNAILTYLFGICTDEGRKQLKNIFE